MKEIQDYQKNNENKNIEYIDKKIHEKGIETGMKKGYTLEKSIKIGKLVRKDNMKTVIIHNVNSTYM